MSRLIDSPHHQTLAGILTLFPEPDQKCQITPNLQLTITAYLCPSYAASAPNAIENA